MLPSWYNLYKKHKSYWYNGSVEDEILSICCYPKNNIYRYGTHLEIMKTLQTVVSQDGYNIDLYSKENVQFFTIFNETTNLYIICNLSSQCQNDKTLDTLLYGNDGYITFIASKGLYRRWMISLYKILKEFNIDIVKTTSFPHEEDEISWKCCNL